MTGQELPAPPLPQTVDLRDFPGMMLQVARLRDSAIVFKTRPEEFRSAVLLWCASWHQVPAASLPDDDAELAKYAGYGLAVKSWVKVRAGALHGFVKCADGRLYHGVVAKVAIAAWITKLKGRWEREKGRLKKEAQRLKRPAVYPEFSLWVSRECPEALPYMSPGQYVDVPEDIAPPPPGRTPPVPRETPSKRREEKGREEEPKPPKQRFPGGDTTQGPLASLGAAAVAELKAKALTLDQAKIEGGEDTPAAVLASVLNANGIKGNSFHPCVVDWARDGITVDRLKQAIATARQRPGKDAPGAIRIEYLDPIVHDDEKPKGKPWKSDDHEAEALCHKLGIKGSKVGEQRDVWHQRIETALAEHARSKIA